MATDKRKFLRSAADLTKRLPQREWLIESAERELRMIMAELERQKKEPVPC